MPETWNPAGSPTVRFNTRKKVQPESGSERVSLAPLSPETALRALLATPPPASTKKESRKVD